MVGKIRFTKMQGAGNDYVYVNCFDQKVDDPNRMAQWVSDRHFGVGSDGLVLIMPSESCDFRMRMFNSDGTEAEMCGNATRCVGKYVYDNKLTKKTNFTLETKAGVKYLSLILCDNGEVSKVKVDMGEPVLKAVDVPVISKSDIVVDEPIEIDGRVYKMTCVSMGNPHAIVFVDDVKSIDINVLGPKFECHKAFPKRTNTEFVQFVSPKKVKMRVWERGAGETLACGTGACATLVACCLNKKTETKIEVELLGGSLEIEWDKETNKILMTGPAKTVFNGEFDWE